MILDKIFGKHSAKVRITVGLVSIIVSLTLIAVLIGIFPDETVVKRNARQALTETIATQSSIFITQTDYARMKATLQVIVERNSSMLSAAVYRDGAILSEIGQHVPHWDSQVDLTASNTQVVIPLWSGQEKWGSIQVRFAPIIKPGILGFLMSKVVLFISFMSCAGFLAYFFYLGKMLKHLDPSQAVPDHVRSALDTMAEGLLVLDKHQNIVLANESFSTIVNQPSQQMVGKSVSIFQWLNESNEPLAQSAPWKSSIDSGQVLINQVIRLTLPDKGKRTFMVNCSPVLLPGGKVGGVLVSFDDVTLLEEKELELRRSKEDAEAANRAKSDFLANMSHEIRTPMNAILGFTDMLRRDRSSLQPGQEQHLNTISASGQHLLNLINDILDLSKVESGSLEIESINCNPVSLVQEVLQIMKVKADEGSLDLIIQADTPVPSIIQTDPGKVRQILTNLIGNAIKFTEKGSITVNIQAINKAPYQLLINVTDTGIGMTQEQADSVFEAFVQADSSITRRFGGTGLGLSISKQFADALGGEIRVTSESGKGTTFTLVLDISTTKSNDWIVPNKKTLSIEVDKKEEFLEWEFPKSHVLVIDDGKENRELIKLILSDLGIEHTTGVDGLDGLTKAGNSHYDAILMDVQMPVMDGYTAATKMRETGLNVPIVALTAHAMKGIEKKCLAAGYSHYMTKPINIDALIKLLVELLKATPKPSDLLGKATPANQFQEDLRSSISPLSNTDALPAPTETLDLSPIISTLPISNPKFADLVFQFLNKLEDRIVEIEQAITVGDFSTLADHGHWLKGSGGSVGLMPFTDIAIPFEEAANSQQMDKVELKFADIKQYLVRAKIGLGDAALTNKPIVTENNTSSISSNLNESNCAAIIAFQAHEKAVKDEPISSSLVSINDKFKPLVSQFYDKLQLKIDEMQKAIIVDDFSTLEDLGHWLKGSAGSVGFNQFTDIAAELEVQANQKSGHNAQALLDIIVTMFERMTVN